MNLTPINNTFDYMSLAVATVRSNAEAIANATQEVQTHLTQCHARIAELEAYATAFESEVQTHLGTITDREQTISNLNTALSSAQDTRAEVISSTVAAETFNLRQQIDNISAQLNDSQVNVTSLQNEISRLNAVIDAAQNP